MMSKFKKDYLQLNTNPLLSELNETLNKGVQNILKDILKRYELLEQTHNAILNLPTIKDYIVNINEFENQNMSDVDFDEINNLNDIAFEKQDNISYDEFINFQKSTTSIIDKLTLQIEILTNEIKELKLSNKLNSEKENIKLEIVETVSEMKNDEEKFAYVEEEVEEEEEEEEEVEEEDVDEEEEEIKSVETETREDLIDKEDEDEEDEEELFEIEIDDSTYCTNNENNGFIYELDKDGNVGKKVGYLKDGEPYFY